MNTKLFRLTLVEKNISQNRLAQKLGIHPVALSHYVCGYRKMKPQVKRAICKALGLNKKDLFEETQNHEGTNQ